MIATFWRRPWMIRYISSHCSRVSFLRSALGGLGGLLALARVGARALVVGKTLAGVALFFAASLAVGLAQLGQRTGPEPARRAVAQALVELGALRPEVAEKVGCLVGRALAR